MRRIYFTIFSLIVTASAASAQRVLPLSFEQCVEYALKNNYAVKNARLDQLIAEAQVKQTLAIAYPHLNAKADLTNFVVPQSTFVDASKFPGAPPQPAGTVIPLAFQIDYTSSAALNASQIIFDGSVFVAVQARKSVLELARRTEEVTEETIRYNVLKAYNSLVIAYKQYDIIKSSLVYARSIERDLEKMRNIGVAEKIDVDRTSVQVNNLATDSMRIGNMLVVSEQVLKYTMGMDINMPIVLTDTNLSNKVDETMDLLTTVEDYNRVPEFKLAQTALEVSQYNLKRYKMAGLPTLAAFGSLGTNYGAINIENLFDIYDYPAYSLWGLTLSMPLFQGFQRTNQVKEAGFNIAKAKNNIDNLKLTIDFKTATARTTLRNSILQVQSQQRNLELSQSILELAQKKYKAGVGSNLEVTTAQSDLLRTQNIFFVAMLDVINADADLKKALGLLK
jgi:outer membrane protein TolC